MFQYTIPCKLGDIAWGIRNYKGHKLAKRGVVSEMYFVQSMNGGMELHMAVRDVCRGKWGETVFGTREEADAALRGKTYRTMDTEGD